MPPIDPRIPSLNRGSGAYQTLHATLDRAEFRRAYLGVIVLIHGQLLRFPVPDDLVRAGPLVWLGQGFELAGRG